MYISEANINIGKQTYTREIADKKSQRVSDAPKNQGIREDTVSLSDDLKNIQLAKQSVQADGVDSTMQTLEREEKVQQLKQAVSEGSYVVNAEKVAEKIVGFSMDEYI